ncbi:hypothetical protein RFI_31617 [Reticulomyxa filosa]|uniref:Uncharacterized protein n=1 Tax=Reticulomyxa filosa TaxID=46433 RepID=X6LYG9_RETFI|nr:hypothetical protein RFI_31617 [Reticulomyxa filosa]|eukprot:ETO05780.1 hypothetical protein RFI_31617 [Reticulomyxa filosa]
MIGKLMLMGKSLGVKNSGLKIVIQDKSDVLSLTLKAVRYIKRNGSLECFVTAEDSSNSSLKSIKTVSFTVQFRTSQEDTKLSQSILKFLSQKDKSVWDNICSMDNCGKCWRVMLTAFKRDFEQWNSYLTVLEKIGIFENDQVRQSFLEQFLNNNEFSKLVTASAENSLEFITFFQEQKIM